MKRLLQTSSFRWHRFLSAAAFVFLAACGASSQRSSDVGIESNFQTDLGLTGNARVLRNFQAYIENSTGGCHGLGSGRPRLLISGFGPFNRSRNISGAVVGVLQRRSLWPDRIDWPSTGEFSAPEFAPDDLPGRWGAWAVQRTLSFDGREYDVCLLKLTVEWDFAAAVILHEAEKFRPDFILMTGYGSDLTGVRLESAALNKTRRLSGFDPQGRALGEVNSPVSEWILPSELNPPDVLPMNWNAQRIAQMNGRRLNQVSESLGRTESRTRWTFVPVRGADPLNDYICNNVSYAVLAGLRSEVLPLAGGKLILRPRFAKTPAAAFMHYPYEANVSSVDEVWTWAHVLMSVATTAVDSANNQ